MSRIGSKIRDIRTEKGLSAKALAKKMGVAEQFILDVESGKRVISDDQIARASKVLDCDISQTMLLDAMAAREAVVEKETAGTRPEPAPRKLVEPEVQKVWNDAFDHILKTLQVYDYSLNKALGVKQLPVVNNRVEGFAKDKVAYIEIQDKSMTGYRIRKGDLALLHQSKEPENGAISLIEVRGERRVRQLKKIDGDKWLLLGNDGQIATETVFVKEMTVLGKLVRLEIQL